MDPNISPFVFSESGQSLALAALFPACSARHAHAHGLSALCLPVSTLCGESAACFGTAFHFTLPPLSSFTLVY